MMSDVNFGGVFVPGLLVVALVALACTLLLVPLFTFSRLYRSLPARPLIGFATYIFTFFLLMQGLNALGLLA
ncbi:DUF1656 domain-containing protein [Raoultella sp. WB_B2P2-3]|jgi:hypothetical protein|uniref:DUF1656 domain-containing protein n=1 Tax=Raoultella scottii TaxID=3040937 RepID=A0ABU8ZA15_9ENTR|nr:MULTISPECIES: DUF1656 domain-containing protein [Enterobacteriaceae]MVT02158.1 DUF1656 domain-containing protein [Raoultella sp. 10-1]PAC14669.1 hypothetical protein CD006_05735 [Enterobacter sp. 10-1]